MNIVMVDAVLIDRLSLSLAFPDPDPADDDDAAERRFRCEMGGFLLLLVLFLLPPLVLR